MSYFIKKLFRNVAGSRSAGDSNTNIWLSYENNQPGTIGIAYVRSVCSGSTRFRVNVNEYRNTDSYTGDVSIHSYFWTINPIGFNLPAKMT